ncbi:MAG: TspO/MBR family protein [Patescibacteria group bacterium]
MENRGLKVNYLLAPLGVLIVSLAGGYFTGGGMDWYDTLNKPGIAPSGSFIGIVWTIIFILSAISILLFSNDPKTNRKSLFFKLVVFLFIINGLLNIFWSVLFFSWNLILASVIEMCILNSVNLLLILMLWKNNKSSAVLLIPYFVWVCLATYLAYSIYILN